MRHYILISQRHTINQHGDWVDSLENNYVALFESLNASLIPVSNTSKHITDIFNDIEVTGIILTGGGEVNPALYSGEADTKYSVSDSRDKTEALLLDHARENNIPVLGICRGMQFINVYFHGKLLQDIKSIDQKNQHLTPGLHPIVITHQPLLNLLDNNDTFEVNSFHNLGILKTMLASDLSAFAEYTELSLVEGFFHRKYPIAAIQWHPERKQQDGRLDKVLLQSFFERELFWK